jgi:hypothetical protein
MIRAEETETWKGKGRKREQLCIIVIFSSTFGADVKCQTD